MDLTVNYGSLFYFLYPLSGIAIAIALYCILRNRSYRVKYWALFGLLAANFALHFLKLLFYPYNDPGQYSKNAIIFTLSPNSICALNVLIFPFLYLTKRPVFKDYIFTLGIIGGFSAVWLPSMGDFDTTYAISFDAFRFYTCHGLLWITGFLMVALGVHKLNYHRIWAAALTYMVVVAVVFANNCALWYTGVTTGISNNGYVIKIPDAVEDTAVGKILLALVPSWFKPSAARDTYWPVLWQLFPVYILGCPLVFLMFLPWEAKHFVSDIKKLLNAARGSNNTHGP